MDPLTAGIAAAGGLAQTAASMFSSNQLNRKNRKHQWDMWKATNAYNSPKSQMGRFKDAGLNPHLIYGEGTPGNATHINPNEPKQPDFSGIGSATMSYVAVRKQQREIDNMETAERLMQADIIKRGAETLNTLASTDKTKLDTKLTRDLYTTTLAQAEANLRGTKVETQKKTQEIENLLASKNLTEAQTQDVLQRTQESVQRVKNMIKDGNIKDAELEFKRVVAEYAKRGINFNTGYKDQFIKALLQVFGLDAENLGGQTPSSIYQKAQNKSNALIHNLWIKIKKAFK